MSLVAVVRSARFGVQTKTTVTKWGLVVRAVPGTRTKGRIVSSSKANSTPAADTALLIDNGEAEGAREAWERSIVDEISAK